MKFRNLIIVMVLLLSSQIAIVARTGHRLCLWYNSPAVYGEGALPFGNGRLCAMVSGSMAEDALQLNEDTFWSGSTNYNVSDYRCQLDLNTVTPLASADGKALQKAQGPNTNLLIQTCQLSALVIANRSKLTQVSIP